jgi:hypothetical protein
VTAPYHLSIGRFRTDNAGVVFISAPGAVQAWCDGQAIALSSKHDAHAGSFTVPPEIDTARFDIAIDGTAEFLLLPLAGVAQAAAAAAASPAQVTRPSTQAGGEHSVTFDCTAASTSTGGTVLAWRVTCRDRRAGHLVLRA